jgi:hypothetical protein
MEAAWPTWSTLLLATTVAAAAAYAAVLARRAAHAIVAYLVARALALLSARERLELQCTARGA